MSAAPWSSSAPRDRAQLVVIAYQTGLVGPAAAPPG
jgi:hypothetical protein